MLTGGASPGVRQIEPDVVFHMMSALAELGRTGMTAVGDSPRQADEIYRRAERVLVDEAEPPVEPPLPPV